MTHMSVQQDTQHKAGVKLTFGALWKLSVAKVCPKDPLLQLCEDSPSSRDSVSHLCVVSERRAENGALRVSEPISESDNAMVIVDTKGRNVIISR